ncbi:MAG: hypothetical protein ACFFDS_07905 [Candidatus Thorarchaeota archaeon]
MQNIELYKLSKIIYREGVLHSQLQSAGSNQARFLERIEKDKMARMPDMILKFMSAIYIGILFIIPLRSFGEIYGSLLSGISIEWVTLVGGGSIGAFMLFQPIILLVFSITFVWGLMSGGPYEWVNTLPFGKKDVQKLGLFTFFRSMNVQLIILALVLPVGSIVSIFFFLGEQISMVNCTILVLFSIIHSFVSIVFYLSIAVILGRKLAVVMEEHEGSSKRNNIIRIGTMILYLVVSMLAMYLIQIAMDKIPLLYTSEFLLPQTANIINIVLSFIAYPFSSSYILTGTVIGFFEIPPLVVIGSVIGFILFVILTIFVFSRALRTLRSITSTDIKLRDIEEKKLEIEDIVAKKVTPVKAFFKRDLSIITREMQGIMYLIIPIMIPIYGAIVPFDFEPIGPYGLSGNFLVLVFYIVMTSYMLIVGLTNIEAGGETITASLPIVVRDQIKAKVPYFFGTILLAYLSWFLFIIKYPEFWTLFRFGLLYLPIIPIAGIAGLFFKVATFGKLKHKFVLEEIQNKNKILKYIMGFIFVGIIAYGFALIGGFFGYWIMFGAEIVLAAILYVTFHFMFPKPTTKIQKA